MGSWGYGVLDSDEVQEAQYEYIQEIMRTLSVGKAMYNLLDAEKNNIKSVLAYAELQLRGGKIHAYLKKVALDLIEESLKEGCTSYDNPDDRAFELENFQYELNNAETWGSLLDFFVDDSCDCCDVGCHCGECDCGEEEESDIQKNLKKEIEESKKEFAQKTRWIKDLEESIEFLMGDESFVIDSTRPSYEDYRFFDFKLGHFKGSIGVPFLSTFLEEPVCFFQPDYTESFEYNEEDLVIAPSWFNDLFEEANKAFSTVKNTYKK